MDILSEPSPPPPLPLPSLLSTVRPPCGGPDDDMPRLRATREDGWLHLDRN